MHPSPQNPSMTQLSEAQFKTIADLAYQEAGLVFPPSKAPLVRSRIIKRLRALKIKSFEDYCSFISGQEGANERRMMVSSLTTNISSFFREPHHFEILRKDVLPPLLERARQGQKIRIWSAGCSTGQEAYSIAITIAEMEPKLSSMDIRILASDIDPEVIRTGQEGFYRANVISDVPENQLTKYFQPEEYNGKNGARVIPEIRSIVSFRELNLLGEWPMKRSFEIIFCRNVVIYFDAESKKRLWEKFNSSTSPGGWLFIGHSERLPDDCHVDYIAAGPTVYRRPIEQH